MAGLIGWLVACLVTLAFSAIRPMECFIIMTAILMACSRTINANDSLVGELATEVD